MSVLLKLVAQMTSPYVLAFLTYLALNLVVFFIYWHDKAAARNGGWRIREGTLLWLAALGGSVGAMLAQRLLRHKTQKEPFRTILLAIIVGQIALVSSIVIIPEWPGHAINIFNGAF